MKQYIKNKQYETVHFDDEWIIMNTDTYTVTKLNELGGYCWELLGSPHSIQSLITIIIEKYEMEKELNPKDVEAFLEELVEYGLVKNAG